MKRTVLLTGAGGRVGTCLREAFREKYDLRVLDKSPIDGEPDTILNDLSDFEGLKEAMMGVDTVVHLAAQPTEAPFNEVLVPNNVIGLNNTLEAARLSGVKRIIFASTAQAVARYPHEEMILATDPFRSITLYGATKALGEVMGRWFYDYHNLEFVAIRIGWFIRYDETELLQRGVHSNIWLSERDCQGIFTAAIEKENVGFGVVFGTSKTLTERLSRAEGKELLGWEPVDDAADFLKPEEEG